MENNGQTVCIGKRIVGIRYIMYDLWDYIEMNRLSFREEFIQRLSAMAMINRTMGVGQGVVWAIEG